MLTLSDNIVAPKTTETTGSNTISLSAGTWLICGYMDWDASLDGICNYKITVAGTKSQTVRASGWNGGGVSNAFIVTISSAKTVSQIVYQNAVDSVTARASLTAVKLF